MSITLKKICRIFTIPIKGVYLIFLPMLFACLFYFFYEKIENFFVFFPDTSFISTPDDWGLKHEEIFFATEDRVGLHGWFFPTDSDQPVLLFFHGNAGNISHRLENVRSLVDQDLQVFIIDYRGYGKSEGKPSELGLYKDGLAAYDYLIKQKKIPPERIVPFGRSLGASVAIEVSVQRKVGSLVVESGFTSTKDMGRTMFPFSLFAFLLPPNYNNLEKIKNISAPKLIFHGDKDDLVPFSMGKDLFRASKAPTYFYPIHGAGHNDTYVVGGKAYFETLLTFVREKKIKSVSANLK